MSGLSRPSRALLDAARAGSRLDPALKSAMRASLHARVGTTSRAALPAAFTRVWARAPWINLVLVSLGVTAAAVDGETTRVTPCAPAAALVSAAPAMERATSTDATTPEVLTARDEPRRASHRPTRASVVATARAAHGPALRPIARPDDDVDEPWPGATAAPTVTAPVATPDDDERIAVDDATARPRRRGDVTASALHGPWVFELGASLSAPIQMRLPVLGDEPQAEVSLRLGVARRVTSHLRVAGTLHVLPWTFGADARARTRVAGDVRAYVALTERGFDSHAAVSVFARAGVGYLDGAHNDPRAGGPLRGMVGVGLRIEAGASRGLFVAAEGSWVVTLPEAHAVETSLVVGLRP